MAPRPAPKPVTGDPGDWVDTTPAAKDPGDWVDSTPASDPWANGISVPMRNSGGPIVPKDVPETGAERMLTAPLRFLTGGAEQLGRGGSRMASPESADDFVGGLADVAYGGSTLALPAFTPSMLAHPIMTALGLGGTTLGAGMGRMAAEMMGAGPGTKELATVGGGILGGGLASRGASKVSELMSAAAENPALKDALINLIPVYGPKINKIRTAIRTELPPPPEAPEPFKPSPVTKRNMPKYSPGPSSQAPGMPRSTGQRTGTRRVYEPPPKSSTELPPMPDTPATSGATPPASGGTLYSKTRQPKSELTSQIHALGREMDLPGSPAGKSIQVTPTAMELFGKKWSDLEADQMAAITEFVMNHKRLPTAADAKGGLFR